MADLKQVMDATDCAIQALEWLEWSDRCAGCTTYAADMAEYFRCCPTCRGLKPVGYLREVFPESQIGHRTTCELKHHLDALKDSRG